MVAVIFEVYPAKKGKAEYLAIAAKLREFLKGPGFISIERFQSLSDENKVLSLSFWESEEAVQAWRNQLEHRSAQQRGKQELFEKYRIRIAQVVRDYTSADRDQAPPDSNSALGCNH
ncbi:MAG: antibiotic biosynthesis monooxygenase [Candidatus Ozemobacteraceae bacterium]